MKKILFLLLLSIAGYGQTSTGQEQEFDYGIKNNSTQTITTPTYLTTQGVDGTYGKIPSAYIAKTAAVQDSLNKKLNLPTGFLQGLQLSINADPTKFNIAAGYYVVTDFTNLTQPVVKIINYAGATGLTPAYLATANSTYIALDKNQNVISSASPFTDAQRRSLAIIGNVVHSNHTTINVVNEIKAPIVAVGNQLHDFMKAIGFLNESGNVYSANGANLQINKSVGDIFGMGINASDYLSPHKLTIPSQTALTFAYRFQNGTQLADTQNINPNIYDVGGTSTATPSNKWTIQRINLFQSGLSRIQPGQTVYNSFNDAVVALPTQPFVTEQNIADNAVFRCYLIVQQGTTNLASAVAGGSAQFVPVDKFGNIIGNGSVALTYSNIVAALGFTPENQANKSDSYTASSSTTYASTKALVDGLSTKAPISGSSSYIQNQSASAQSANMWISGTGQFGTTGNNNNNVKILDGTIITKIQSQTLGDTAGAAGTETNHDFKVITNNIERLRFLNSGAATFASTVTASNGTLIGGTLTSGYIPKATGANSLGNSLVYDNGTNVGVGTTATLTKLTINGNLSLFTTNQIRLCNSAKNNWTEIASPLLSGDTEVDFRILTKTGTFYINSSGNVGIGTITPTNTLQLRKTASSILLDGLKVERDPSTTSSAIFNAFGGATNVVSNGGSAGFFPGVIFSSSDNTTLNELFRINGNGNAIIGTTTDNGIDRFQVNGTISANAATTSNQVVVKSQLDGKVSLTGNETVAGNKTLSGTTTLNETIIREGYQLKFPKGVMYQSSVGTNALTDNRTVSFPDASGTVALVETVRPYKVYTALLSQSGTSAPTATVFENTLGGTIVWTRSNIGQYVGTLTGAFTDQKTIIFVNRSNPSATAFDTNMAANVININTVGYTTFSNSAYVDGQTNSASIEIRVYN